MELLRDCGAVLDEDTIVMDVLWVWTHVLMLPSAVVDAYTAGCLKGSG